MAHPRTTPPDLREFIADLRASGDLAVVEAEVDSRLEAAEIHRRVIAAGGPALWFSKVRGCDFPLVTNLFGTASRVERAFGRRPREFIGEVARLPEELMPPTLGKLWAKRGLFASLARIGLSRRSSGPVSEVVDSPPRLARLPALQTWPRDGGRFITLPLVTTEHPVKGTPNLGMYRIQLYDEADGGSRTGLHMQIGKGGGFHLAEAEAAGRALSVNISVGGPPALILSAIAPLPENVPEVLLASLLLKRKLGLADNPAGPLPLFADAEFALVGEVACGARRAEGPFGDHYGYYSEIHDYPLFSCKSLCRRKDAIFPATVVGKPRQEDFFLGDYLQELLSPLFPLVMPGVRDLWSYGETGYHSLGAAVVRERYKRESMASAFRILGEGQLALTKFLLLTDSPVDLRDFKQTLVHVLERADFRTDLFVFANLSMDSLDYAGPRINEGGKGVLLGCGAKKRELPREFHGVPPAGVRDVRVFVPGCLVLTAAGHAEDPGAPARLAGHSAFRDWPLIVVSDDALRATRSSMNFLWTTFTRFDPAADIHAAKTELVHNHASHTAPIAIDARMKAWYPKELSSDPATAALVSRRWKEYFPAGRVEMGDAEAAHLD
ncbi:MAG: UbiD family decarboxylase [Planctomycetes bacterium]|nr:UbiD family decarboxylase [Planctomycetota bacterium]